MNFILPCNHHSIIPTPFDCPRGDSGFRVIFTVFALKIAANHPDLPFGRDERHELPGRGYACMLERAILKNFVFCLGGVYQVDRLVDGEQYLNRARQSVSWGD